MPELSYENKKTLLMDALNPSEGADNRVWIRDLYDDRVIVDDNDKLMEVAYTIEDNKAVLGERKEVKVSYEALAELKDIPVLKVGTFTAMSGKRVTFTHDDLEEIAANSEAFKDQLKPPLVATHNEGVDASIQVFGSVDGGKFHNVRKVDDQLIADLRGMPAKAAELLGEVEEFRLSPETYTNFEDDNGVSHGRALRRVAMVNIPAIKTMGGITADNLFEETPDQPTTWVKLHEPNQSPTRKGNNTMLETVEELKEKLQLSEQQNVDLKADNDAKQVKLSEVEVADKVRKAKEMVAPLIEAGLATPAADLVQSFAEQLGDTDVLKFGEKDQTPLDAFNEVLDTLFQRQKDGKLMVKFGEEADGSDGFSEEDGERAEMVKNVASAAPAPGN